MYPFYSTYVSILVPILHWFTYYSSLNCFKTLHGKFVLLFFKQILEILHSHWFRKELHSAQCLIFQPETRHASELVQSFFLYLKIHINLYKLDNFICIEHSQLRSHIFLDFLITHVWFVWKIHIMINGMFPVLSHLLCSFCWLQCIIRVLLSFSRSTKDCIFIALKISNNCKAPWSTRFWFRSMKIQGSHTVYK